MPVLAGDNSTSQLFLTSPIGFHSLQLRLSPTLSTPSTLPLSRGPTISVTSEQVAAVGGSIASCKSTKSVTIDPEQVEGSIASGKPTKSVTTIPWGSDMPDVSRGALLTPNGQTITRGVTIAPIQHTTAVTGLQNGTASTSSNLAATASITAIGGTTFDKVSSPAISKPSFGGVSGKASSPPVNKNPSSTHDIVSKSSSDAIAKSPAPGSSESMQLASHDTLGSSLGLPSELLAGLSGSSCFGSDSEGDTIRSALASALGLRGLTSTEDSAILSADASTEAMVSLSQSVKSLPRDTDLPIATPPPDHTQPRETLSLSSASESIEVRTVAFCWEERKYMYLARSSNAHSMLKPCMTRKMTREGVTVLQSDSSLGGPGIHTT